MNNRKRISGLYALAVPFFVFLVTACSTTSDPVNKPAAQSLSAAQTDTGLQVNKTLRPGATFSWGPKYFLDAPRFKDTDAQQLVEETILEVLTGKGFQYAPQSNQTDLQVEYVILSGDTLSATGIEELLMREPELKTQGLKPENFENGTMIITVRDKKSQRMVWQGKKQDVVNLEMPENTRKQRLRSILEDVFATFPQNIQ